MTNFRLTIDDSGTSRFPNRGRPQPGASDWFALGGVLYRESEKNGIKERVVELKTAFNISSPLRSYDIRQKKGAFDWLSFDRDRATKFYENLTELLAGIEIHCVAVVIDRPGYNLRYDSWGEQKWDLCKTAYSILVERSVKAVSHMDSSARLQVIVEETGKKEDGLIRHYHSSLISNACPFDKANSNKYNPLDVADFRHVLFKNVRFSTKRDELTQIADLVLYPIVQHGYGKGGVPFDSLRQHGRVLDETFHDGTCGIKYYCFDQPKCIDFL